MIQAHRALIDAGLRDRVELWCDGGMKTGSDAVKMICSAPTGRFCDDGDGRNGLHDLPQV